MFTSRDNDDIVQVDFGSSVLSIYEPTGENAVSVVFDDDPGISQD